MMENMIKLATVFSGIGVIEHALDRMNIKHEIVFACNNGDVDILNKEVGMNIDDINDEIKAINAMISELQIDDPVESLYKQQLFGMLKETTQEYNLIFNLLTSLNECDISIENILTCIKKMVGVKSTRKKSIHLFLKN